MTNLDDAYANGKYIEDADSYPPRWAQAALSLRTSLTAKQKCRLDIPYGDQPREKFDLFLPDAAPRGLVVFVHGGYWKAFDKSSFSHLAAGALARDIAVAIPSYTLCPEGTIAQITRQITTAIEAAAAEIAGPIHLVGHSAGGHLVTRMLCRDIDWQSCFEARIKSVVSISGVHDLRPLLNTTMNEDFKLDMQTASAESPLLNDDVLPVPVTAWVGGEERPVFIDQSRQLAERWDNATLHLDAGRHHFDVINGLLDADSPLMRALLPD